MAKRELGSADVLKDHSEIWNSAFTLFIDYLHIWW
jgi:hypothetical protein